MYFYLPKMLEPVFNIKTMQYIKSFKELVFGCNKNKTFGRISWNQKAA